jgi:2-polyprenyl-6-methoxyphenol hydroxylase-like FAD-dependent oxidoreductase
MTADESCDVLIVGAGPTGLMLANWLVKLGVDVIVADGKDGPTRESRALVVQARSLEIYDQLGLGESVIEAAHQATALAPGFGSRVFGRVPLGAVGTGLTPYPYIEVLEQSRNEEILYANLRKLGGDVRWGTPVGELGPDGDGVRAVLGDSSVRARFCVGADGANSVVRRSRNIAFDGVTNPYLFYVIDATGTGGLVEDAINVRPGREDFMVAFPMNGRGNWRLIGSARDSDGDGDVGETDARGRLHDEFAVTYAEARWYATYRVHHRVAAQFRDGPFLLAGDAAHVHSPVGGQGMNTGLQDAHNLAFKLADVVQGRAGDEWLDRYEAERRPVAQTLVATTDRVFGLITSRKAWVRLLRATITPLVAPLGVRVLPRSGGGSRFFAYVAQIRIHYWMSRDAKRLAGGRRDPIVGRRLPWSGANFEVLRSLRWQIHAYGGIDASAVPDLGVPVHVFEASPPFAPGRLYLVRPDGFVAAEAGLDDAESLRAAMPAVVGSPS